MKFVTEDMIKKWCGNCKSLEIKTAKLSGKQYSYCNSYLSPIFKCLDDCKKEAQLSEDRAINAMEEGITRLELDYTGEYRRGF